MLDDARFTITSLAKFNFQIAEKYAAFPQTHLTFFILANSKSKQNYLSIYLCIAVKLNKPINWMSFFLEEKKLNHLSFWQVSHGSGHLINSYLYFLLNNYNLKSYYLFVYNNSKFYNNMDFVLITIFSVPRIVLGS